MTSFTLPTSVPRRLSIAYALGAIPPAVLLVLPLALLMGWPRAVAVWQTGSFFDTDDALRIVEVRDWLAGQGWYDLVTHRIAGGLPMHWSRVVDVPLAALIGVFRRFADPVHAERLARLAFPLGLTVGMIAATAWTARLLAGRSAVLPAALLLVLSGIAYGQFQPGRVDHHAPQILLLMLATGTTLASLDPRRVRWATLTALSIALSLGISLENLPFFAVLLAVPPVAWAVRGDDARPLLLTFAASLGLALPAVFCATVGPGRWLAVAPDAFSFGQLAAIEAGALVLALLTLVKGPSGAFRWACVIVAGALLGAFVLLVFPAVLRGPYAGVDPLIERLWLSGVHEAQPVTKALRERPDTIVTIVGPILAGLLAGVLAVVRRRGLERARWLVVLALVLVGCAGTFWEIRVAGSVAPLALLPGAWAVARSFDAARGRRPLALLLPIAAVPLFSAIAWAFLPVPGGTANSAAEAAAAAACRDPAALAPLAGLPAATAFAPIDAGSYILAHTSMGAVGAPYHRNTAGNLAVLRGFLAPPEAARAFVEAAGARFVLVCPGDPQLETAASLEPQGLAAQLLRGHPPAWLIPLAVPGTIYRVYEVASKS